MSAHSFVAEHFNDALAIAAASSDLGYSHDDAKLFTYIHVKSKTHPAGDLCFSGSMETEIDALEMLLGIQEVKKRPFDTRVASRAKDAAGRYASAVVAGIQTIDHEQQKNFGKELGLRSELLIRLRFHKDDAFREKALAAYRNDILPVLSSYTSEKISRAFTREKMLLSLNGSKNKEHLN